MPIARRSLLAAPALLGVGPAAAQAFPDRPLRLVIAFPPGGTTDVLGRILATHLGQRLGQPVVVENRAGAGGSLGTELVVNARPDGYTLLLGANGGLVVNTLIMSNLPYDPFRQLQPIGLLALVPMVVVVRADSPVRSVQELVAAARARPGRVTVGTPGIGTSNHLVLSLLNGASGAGFTHVPYRGASQLTPDLLAGNVDAMVDQLPTALTLAREGRTRLLAITAEQRSPLAPELPTLAEAGFAGAVMTTFFGLTGPAGLPQEVVARLQRALNESLADSALRERFASLGAEPASPALASPEGFAGFLQADLARARRAVEIAGLKPE